MGLAARGCSALARVVGRRAIWSGWVREDEMREAVAAARRWYAARPEQAEADEAERIAAAEERGESA